MNRTTRRRPNRPRLEALDLRTLLSNAGALDPSFGTSGTGYASMPLFSNPVSGNSSETVSTNSVVTAPNGQIVVSGIEGTLNASLELTVADFNANGTPNSSFGGGSFVAPGLVEYTIGTFGEPGSKPVTAVQSDGKIIEAVFGAPGFDQTSPLIVFRLDANGSLDTTFGTNGVDIFPSVSSATATVNPLSAVGAVVVQSNGQILLAGDSYNSTTGASTFAVMRLNANGSVDTTYGTNGISSVPVIPNSGNTINGNTIVGAALQSNGQLVVVGDVVAGLDISVGEFGAIIDDVGVIRLNTDGTLDTTFGGSTAAGIVLLSSNSSGFGSNTAYGMAIDSNDNILISGYNTYYSGSGASALPTENTLYRLTSNGILDSTFGTNGLVSPIVAGQVVAQSNGSIDVAGLSYPAIPGSFNTGFGGTPAGPSYVEQFNANGTPNTSFGNTTVDGVGVFQTVAPLINPTTSTFNPAIEPTTSSLNLAIEPTNGDILVAGTGSIPTINGRNFAVTVASLLPAASTSPAAPPIETQPASLDGSGQTDLAVYDPANGVLYYRPAGTTGPQDVADPFGSAGLGQSIPAAADYLGNGLDQVAVYLPAFGDYAIQATANSPGVLMQFGMAGAGQTIPVPADYEGTGKADIAVYMPSIASFAIIPSDGAPARLVQFGIEGAGQSIPAPADYYNTGQADIAVYLAQAGAFAIQDPTGKTAGEVVPFGMPGVGNSIPVPGDYDGSGKTELAVYIPSLGAFFYRPADGGKDVEIPIGVPGVGEIPVPGDYDGSGRTEAAIYDPVSGFFEYRPANGGPDVVEYFGTPNNGTLPVAASAANLPEFTNPLPILSQGIRPNAIVPSSSASGSTSAITLSKASAVPAGPAVTLASVRVARALVNQAAPDPFELA